MARRLYKCLVDYTPIGPVHEQDYVCTLVFLQHQISYNSNENSYSKLIESSFSLTRRGINSITFEGRHFLPAAMSDYVSPPQDRDTSRIVNSRRTWRASINQRSIQRYNQ
ncbi:uncharacterized protein LOC122538697 [Frieseomelitta varia]|uniref:uncharacterized protein LOC122538697 n=1 Tax=Frieseomelitta varia TaxID=561572 RepID=UPI001CB6AC3E|nr:uncharacterized protein LOC122538697 [Frieseomelitta varia]